MKAFLFVVDVVFLWFHQKLSPSNGSTAVNRDYCDLNDSIHCVAYSF